MSDPSSTTFSLEELSHESGLDTRVIRSFIEQGLMRGPTSLGRYARYSRHHLERLQAIKILKERQGLRLSEVRQQLLLMSDAQIAALAETGSRDSNFVDSSALDYILSQSQQFESGQQTEVIAPPPNEFVQNAWRDGGDSAQIQPSSLKNEGHPLSIADAIASRLGFKAKALDTDSQDRQIDDRHEPLAAGHVFADVAPNIEPQGNQNRDLDNEQRITKDRLSTPVDRLVVGLQHQLGQKTARRQSKREVWHRIQVTPDIELSVRGIQDEQHLAQLERVADYLRELLTGGSYE
ncbi:MerR family transcriptional regulator [Candidatus Obscuribacterales bacterium]|nr:MerR family transcriptional regulator [Candidatus Obscuribacterales bacterium]MBX3135804.1 MerR family transcriptional regulator [Candidatus Obscuribacterales bacterium]MBX3153170.1 MerR family transcriptional regulator [Candidatus Obscuribacterales bacterium]